MLRGMRYHPMDIENSVIRCHRKICEWFILLLSMIAYLLILIVNEKIAFKLNTLKIFITICRSSSEADASD